MKKQQNNSVGKKAPSVSTVLAESSSPANEKKNLAPPPNEETINRLNAIAREYPFCVNFKQKNSYLL